MFSALCSLNCYDTDGWVAGRTFIPYKNPFHQSFLEVLFHNMWRMSTQEQPPDPGSPGKWLLNGGGNGNSGS